MYLAGVSYYVLADHFIIHQNHLYEEAAREHEVCPGWSSRDVFS
jgi:glycosyltransferase-like protein LARGE